MVIDLWQIANINKVIDLKEKVTEFKQRVKSKQTKPVMSDPYIKKHL